MNEHVTDLMADLGEVALDSITGNEVLREIPILGTAIGVARAAESIRDRVFLNKVRHFLQNLDEISPEQRTRFKETLEQDPKAQAKTGEAVFSTIERGDSLKKIEYAALAFRAFLDGRLSSDKLRMVCFSIRQAFVDDLEYVVETERIRKFDYDLRFLVPSGLAEETYDFTSSDGPPEPDYKISDIGETLRGIWADYRNVEPSVPGDAW